MKFIKIGIIGLGYLGKFHFEKYLKFKNIKITALCDINPNNLKNFDPKIYFCTDNYKKIIDKVDAVSIVTPTHTHFEIAKFFLENNKDVLLEKPMCSKVREAEILIEIAEKKNRILQIGHLERFNPAVVACKNIITNPMFIEAVRIAPFTGRSTDIDVVRDLMIHDIDIILNFVNEDIKFIHAAGAPVLTNKIDIANVRIVFQNGCTANFTSSRISFKKERKMRIFQKNMYISIDFDKKFAKIYFLKRKNKKKVIKPIDFLTQFRFKKLKFPDKIDQLYNEIESFIECIITRKKPVVDGKAGKKALDISLKILKNLEENLNDSIHRH